MTLFEFIAVVGYIISLYPVFLTIPFIIFSGLGCVINKVSGLRLTKFLGQVKSGANAPDFSGQKYFYA
jgi:hypothetical protein